MYEFYFANDKAEKRLKQYIKKRNSMREKLSKIRERPRVETGAHPLKGRFRGKWSCWLGSNIRMIYSIDDENKVIYIEAVGSHKIY